MSSEPKKPGATNPKVEELIKEGIAASKAGDKATARTKLREAVALDQYSERGWFWLASVVETTEERRVCLNNVIVINPENKRAQDLLEALNNPVTNLADLGPTERKKGQGASKKGEGGLDPQQIKRMALIGGGVVVGLLLVVIVLFGGGGGAPPLPTMAQPAVNNTEPPTSTPNSDQMTEMAVAQQTVAFQTRIAAQPTLPPTWTASPSPTARGTLTGTPLASPPAEIVGRILAIGGRQITLDGYLPVVLIDVASKERRQITSSERGDYGVFAPDGQQVIYARLVSGGGRRLLLRITNLNGTRVEELSARWGNTPALVDQEMVAVARNGRGVVFSARNLAGENEQTLGIYYLALQLPPPGPTETPTDIPSETPTDLPDITPDARPTVPTAIPELAQVKRVTKKDEGNNIWPDISPDGTRIVYISDRGRSGEADADIFIVPVAGGAPRNLTNDGAELNETSPRFSPDGTQVAFSAELPARSGGKKASAIHVMNADGSNRRELVPAVSENVRPRWSPDGKYIAFSSNRTGKFDIFIVDVGSGQLYQLTSGSDMTLITDWGQ